LCSTLSVGGAGFEVVFVGGDRGVEPGSLPVGRPFGGAAQTST
jgi:hypothetical protein